MSVAELKERHKVVTETVNSLRERLKQKRVQLLDTDGWCFVDRFPFSNAFELFMQGLAMLSVRFVTEFFVLFGLCG